MNVKRYTLLAALAASLYGAGAQAESIELTDFYRHMLDTGHPYSTLIGAELFAGSSQSGDSRGPGVDSIWGGTLTP